MTSHQPERLPVESVKVAQDETLRLRNIHTAHQLGLLTGLAAIHQCLYGGPGPLPPKGTESSEGR